MALLPSPSGSHVCPSAPMPGRFITAEFTTARVMTERAGDRAAARPRTMCCARAIARRGLRADGPYPTSRCARRGGRAAPRGCRARSQRHRRRGRHVARQGDARAAHCGWSRHSKCATARGDVTRDASRAIAHVAKIVVERTGKQSHRRDAADETCSRDCFSVGAGRPL